MFASESSKPNLWIINTFLCTDSDFSPIPCWTKCESSIMSGLLLEYDLDAYKGMVDAYFWLLLIVYFGQSRALTTDV